MDCIDTALYRFPEHLENNPEAVRRAFVEIFDPANDNALLVMKHLVGVMHYGASYVSSDETFNSQLVALNGVMNGIKQQLNQKPIEIQPGAGEEYIDE